jgi:hypothetical protein
MSWRCIVMWWVSCHNPKDSDLNLKQVYTIEIYLTKTSDVMLSEETSALFILN